MPVSPDSRCAVLMGGVAAEREVSLRSGHAVLAALQRTGADAVGVVLDAEDLATLPRDVDHVVLALHGGFGEDGRLQALLDARGIGYAGCGPAASRIAMDKLATRAVLRHAGVPIAPGMPAARGADPAACAELVGLPCVVKPRAEGSSLGVSIVRTVEALPAALEAAWAFGREAVIERFVAGTEVTVAILEGRALPLVEVVPADRFFSYEAKYGGRSTYRVDPPLADPVRTAATRAALGAWDAIGCRHYARVDLILDAAGAPVVLEVNTLPGMTGTSLFPKAAAAAGITFEALCQRLAALARASRSSAARAA